MKLLSYRHLGQDSWGGVNDDFVVDLQKASGGKFPTLRSALSTGDLTWMAQHIKNQVNKIPLTAIDYLPVIPEPSKILCAGLNYEDHRLESNRAPTEHPTLFIRFPSSQVGHGQPLLIPRESIQLDYEGEIAVIIGRRGRRISIANAWEHVAGYTAYQDGSVRDWQMHTTQFIGGKNFEATGGLGPWMVTRDEIENNAELELITRLNGRELQRATTKSLIFSIPRLIEYISTFTTLEPGDVIATGTPSGVGFKRTPPLYLKSGDRVELDVSRIGTLIHPVISE